MRRWLIAALLFMAPLQAEARLGEGAPYARKLQSIDSRLRQGQFAEAEFAAAQMLDEALDRVVDGEGVPRLFGMAFTLRAVAAAGLGDRAAAEYWWWSAQLVWPEAKDFNVEGFGDIGLAVRDLGSPQRTTTVAKLPSPESADAQPAIVPPRKLETVEPNFPAAQRLVAGAQRSRGAIDIEYVLDETGRLTRPWILKPDAPTPTVAATLIAAQQWRYDPARRDDEPIAVMLVLKMTFDGRYVPPIAGLPGPAGTRKRP